MKAGVEYSDEILAPGGVEDRPGAKHLAVRGRIQLMLYRDAASTPNLATQGLGVFSKNKISLLAADDGVDLRVEYVTDGNGELHVFQSASMDDVYVLIGVRHPGPS
jgi:hypothetical protein